MECEHDMIDWRKNMKTVITAGKEYQKIEFLPGESIKEAVAKLVLYEKMGESACGEFNGHMLYSDSVSIDSAYMDICGCTQFEAKQQIKEWCADNREKVEEHQKSIPHLTAEWVEKGHKVLDEKYWKLWDTRVPARLGDIYRGMELGSSLDIISGLNSGAKMDEAIKALKDQNHSDMSYLLVADMVKNFSDRGSEFYRIAVQ